MQKFDHGKPSWNFPTIWTNGAEIFFPCKQVENNQVIDNKSQPGLKMIQARKQIDECLSRTMLN